MNIIEATTFLKKQVPNPSLGLPEEIFLFLSQLTPLVSVDLLIQDENGRTLLSWRNDLVGKGWHLPGGILRYKEKLETRVRKVAEKEIGEIIKFNPVPIAINQMFCKQSARGHAVSLLYKCFLSGKFIPENKGLTEKDNGYLKWYDDCPKNLIKVHEIYRKYL